MTDARIACAARISYKGRLVWIPPTGRPYYCDCNPAEKMSDEELEDFLKGSNKCPKTKDLR